MFKPVIIIGAPRSGTNMLRDILCELPGLGTWPCDEINYIWRHGNIEYPSDRFPAELATTQVISYIRKEFEKIAVQQNLSYVVEKTCANSLRVGFVNQVIPEAKYIFIVRNGIDAVASAAKRWKAELDVAYILQKARFVPLSDLHYYALRYLGNRFYRFFSKEKRLAYWGPRLEEMETYTAGYTLEEVCAHQWKHCVDLAEEDFSMLSRERIYTIRYEDFVNSPSLELAKILEFLHVAAVDGQINRLVSNVSAKSVGRGTVELEKDKLQEVIGIIGDTLSRYGYNIP